MGIFDRFRSRKTPSRPQGLQRTTGHRGVGGHGTSPDMEHAANWKTLSADEVEGFVYDGELLFVQSSWVASAQYHHADRKLMVEFLNGGAGYYSDVSEEEATEFAKAYSKGKFLWDYCIGRNEPRGKSLKPWTSLK